jgi:hypothetical protein
MGFVISLLGVTKLFWQVALLFLLRFQDQERSSLLGKPQHIEALRGNLYTQYIY